MIICTGEDAIFSAYNTSMSKDRKNIHESTLTQIHTDLLAVTYYITYFIRVELLVA